MPPSSTVHISCQSLFPRGEHPTSKNCFQAVFITMSVYLSTKIRQNITHSNLRIRKDLLSGSCVPPDNPGPSQPPNQGPVYGGISGLEYPVSLFFVSMCFWENVFFLRDFSFSFLFLFLFFFFSVFVFLVCFFFAAVCSALPHPDTTQYSRREIVR